jgi:predicted esterase
MGYADLLAPYIEEKAHIIVPRGKNSGPKWWLGRAADADQESLSDQMSWTVEDFAPFLDAVRSAFGRRPIVAGHSQGGMMSAALALSYPGKVRKGYAASAWVPEAMWSNNGAPLYLVHGVADTTVPYQRTANWAAEAKAHGAHIEFVPVAGGHGLSGDLQQTWVDAIRQGLRPTAA